MLICTMIPCAVNLNAQSPFRDKVSPSKDKVERKTLAEGWIANVEISHNFGQEGQSGSQH